MFGKKQKKSSKDKMSIAKIGKHIGKNNPMFGKKGKDNPNYGSKRTQEQKDNMSGMNSPHWKGREYLSNEGYWMIWAEGTRYKRSRYITMQYLERKLAKGEEVHHINEDKGDDRPENLYLFPSRSKHMRYHRLKNPPILTSNLI